MFSRIGRLFNRSPTTIRLELVREHGNGFYSWGGNLYQSDIVRSCIRPFYLAAGKLQAKHIRQTADGLKVNPDLYMKMVLEEPNPFMTGQQLQEKLAIQLALNNNAFAAIIRDENGYPMQIYPVPRRVLSALRPAGSAVFEVYT